MIDPVLQFIYQWTLKSPLAGASNYAGKIEYSYRSVLLKDATSAEKTWFVNIYAGDGHGTRHKNYLYADEVNDFIGKYTI